MRIKHSRLFHSLIRVLRLQELSKHVLERYPWQRHLPNGTHYRITSPEAFSVSREVFSDDTYEGLLNQAQVQRFVDLGCNTGYVACLLADRYGADIIQGVLVDANPEMVKESQWHIEKNRLVQCRALWGLVGPSQGPSAPFYLNRFHISSSAKPFDKTYPLPIGDNVTEIDVPIIDLGDLLENNFGTQVVDLMKIDIEGSEDDLLRGDLSFLEKVDWVVMEWHKWVLSFDDAKARFESNNFDFCEILKEDTICGLALFRNRSWSGRL